MKVALQLLRFAAWLIMGLWALYLIGAFYFDMNLGMPAGVTAVLFAAVIAAIVLRFGGRRRILAFITICALVTGAWLTIQPPRDRDWEPLKAVLPNAEFNGDKVTIRNVRDFKFTGPGEYEPAYLDRTIDLSKIAGLDMYVNWWLPGDLVAHPMLSWRFEDSPPITITIESRGVNDLEYSMLGGFYKQFELLYIVSTDRDAVMKRTHYDVNNDIHIYKLSASPEDARKMLLQYLKTVNSIYKKPRWYNTLVNNCTTNIRIHELASTDFPMPWDLGFILPGLFPRGIYREGGMASDLPFEKVEAQGYLNLKAQEIGYVDDFWIKIREDVPGFEVISSPRR